MSHYRKPRVHGDSKLGWTYITKNWNRVYGSDTEVLTEMTEYRKHYNGNHDLDSLDCVDTRVTKRRHEVRVYS